MNSEPNKDKNQERRDQNTLEVTPPFNNEIECFDNPDAYPDLEFEISGLQKPFLLHKRILAHGSGYIKALLKEGGNRKIIWPDETSNEVDREALVKALRFCYGETLIVGTKNGECCAMIAVLTRLQITDLDEIVALY